jgi:hypothetical protein
MTVTTMAMRTSARVYALRDRVRLSLSAFALR